MEQKQKKKVSSQVVLKSVLAKAKPLRDKLKKLIIKDNDTLKRVGEEIKFLKAVDKEGEQQLAELRAPIKELDKKLVELFEPFFTDNENLIKAKKQEVALFVLEQTKKAAQITAAHDAGKIKKTSTFVGKMAETQVELNGRTGFGQRTTKKLQINDETKIPREYMVPNHTAITQALREGKKVGGCELVEVKSITV